MQNKSLQLKFFILKALYYAILVAYSSFILACLKQERTLSDSSSSLLLMVYTIGAFFGQFVFGRLCDYFHTHKKVFFLSCGTIAPVAVILFYVRSFPLIALFYALFGFCSMPLSVIVDTWFLDSFSGDSGLYGKMLASGAFAYALLSFTYGKLLDAVGYSIMPYCLLGLEALACLLAAAIPDASGTTAAQARKGGTLKALSCAPLLVMLIALLAMGMCGNTYSLLPVLMDNVKGGNLGLLGLAMSASGVLQIPFMFFTGKMRRILPRYRLMIAGFSLFLMVMCFAFGNSPWFLVLGACLSGTGWSILLPAYRELIGSIAPAEVRTTAQSLADATYLSLGGVCASGFVSSTSSALGGTRMPLVIIAAVQLADIALIFIAQKRSKRNAA